MPREIGPITDALLLANELDYSEFVKIIFSNGLTLRYTDREGGATENIDGTVQTWIEKDFTHSPLKQGVQDILAVNWLEFPNLDGYWTEKEYSPGIRGAEVFIYSGWWNVSGPSPVFVYAYPTYEGIFDDREIEDESAKLTIKPFNTPWGQPVPFNRMNGRCSNDYRNPDDCQYVGAEPAGQLTCFKTRQACRDRGNEINANIYDDAPVPGIQLTWGGIRHGLPPAPSIGLGG